MFQIRQRVGIDISDIDTSTRMAGAAAGIPAGFAPMGMLDIQNAGGEIKVARATRDFGVPFTMSTMSICSMEQVAEATGASFWGAPWSMLWVPRDRQVSRHC